MIESILWLAVGLMVASSVIPRTSRVRKLVGGIGWGVFSIHWSYQPLHYLKIMDYANVLLTIVVTLFCLLADVYHVSRVQKRSSKDKKQ